MVAWFVAMVARVSPMIIAVLLAAELYSLAIAWMDLATMKVSLATTKFLLAIARVLEQFPQ